MGLLLHLNSEGETSHVQRREPGPFLVFLPAGGACRETFPGLGFSSRGWGRGEGSCQRLGPLAHLH